MTKTFEQMFPGFIQSCTQLHGHLVAVAMVLLVLSFTFLFWSGPPHPMDWIKHLTKLFLIVLLITHAQSIIRDAKAMMTQFVTTNVPARPEAVAQRYKDKLAAAQNDPNLQGQSWWDMLFSADFFEAIIYAILTLVSWLAMALMFYISIFQSAMLELCWVLSPVLFACFAIPLVSGLALRHGLRIIGILCWDLGLALAATITDGLIDVQTDQGIVSGSVLGAASYVLVNLLSVATIAIWIVFSAVLAPAVMQRLLAGSAGPANPISRAASLLANVGLPLAAGSAAGFWASSRSSSDRSSTVGSQSAHPPLINLPDPPPGSPQDPPNVRPLSADDPTAENAVRQALDESTEDD